MRLCPSLCSTIGAVLVAGLASAQTPSPAPDHEHVANASDSGTQTTSPNQSQHLTFSGCVMQHKDVLAAAGTSSVKASGYFLVDAGIVSHHRSLGGMLGPSHNTSVPHAHDAPPAATSGRAVTAPLDAPRERIADSLMFKLTGVPLERLAKLNGRRVQVAGHIDATELIETPSGAVGRSTDVPDAATLVVMAVDAVDGQCQKR